MFKIGVGILLFGILLANFGLEGGVSSIIAIIMGFIGLLLIVASATNNTKSVEDDTNKSMENNDSDNMGE